MEHLSGTLAVILHADIVESTSLVQQDKRLAHERIQTSFQHFGEVIEKFQGRVLELRGDALLASFKRSADAVSAALAFQVDHTDYNAQLQDDVRPIVRVGISMGEVIIADNTVTGTGVVQAQRVEQLAHQGGVCITSAIYESLSKHLPFNLENLGEQVLKGFDDPVRIYRVKLNPGSKPPAPLSDDQSEILSGVTKRIISISVLLLLIVGGTIYWFRAQVPQLESASVNQMAFELPDKPSLVVLPFDNISDDKEQEYFADGITDDLLTALSKLPELFLISRNTSFTYKNKPIKIRQIAQELGVRYVMEGSVRRAGDTVRINAQLIDALSGGHVWAEKYDGGLGDIFKLQDEVVAKIVYSLDRNIIAKKTVTETNVPEAYDLFLRGLEHSHKIDPESLLKAIAFLKQAIQLDPDYYRAHALLAYTYGWIIESEWQAELNMARYQVEGLMRESLNIALKNPTSIAYNVSAWLNVWQRAYDDALEDIDKAIALDPNDPFNFNMKAHILSRTGPAKEAELYALRAIRLNPKSAGTHYRQLGKALFFQDQLNDAVDAFEKSISIDPDYKWHYLDLAATYGQMGELNKAAAALKKFNKIGTQWAPGDLTIQIISSWGTYTEPSHRDRYLEGLRKAGMPEY